MKTALVIGGTGLVGSELIQLLLADNNFTKVIAFGRRATGIRHPKLEEHIIDFSSPASWKNLVTGDVLFSTLGTTLAQAGSKARQYEIDYTYQYNFAAIAAENGVKDYVLISSIGANASSPFFYMKMKGALDDAVSKLPFSKIRILRPAQLVGKRDKKRTGEKIGLKVTYFLNKIGIMRNRKPIKGEEVAKAMIRSLDTDQHFTIYTANQLFDLIKSQ
jgi:uncharacterized protein YbjT (DUF2867 family)